MDGQALAERGVARSGNGLETRNEVDFAIGWDVKGEPGELRGGNVDPFVDW